MEGNTVDLHLSPSPDPFHARCTMALGPSYLEPKVSLFRLPSPLSLWRPWRTWMRLLEQQKQSPGKNKVSAMNKRMELQERKRTDSRCPNRFICPFPSVVKPTETLLGSEVLAIADEGFDTACSRRARSFSSSSFFRDFEVVLASPARSRRSEIRASLSYTDDLLSV